MKLKSNFQSLVPGAKDSGEVLEVVAPFDGEVIGSIGYAGPETVEKALSLAAQLHASPESRLPVWERIAILNRTADLLEERAEDFALESAREGGKPLGDSRVEVARAVDGIRTCAEVLRTQSGEEIPMGISPSSAHRLAFTTHEPIGPVLAFSAFNHPLNLIVHQAVPAVACGCPVVVKPASDTPLSCFRLVELLHEAGLPEEWCQAVVVKDRNLATSMASDSRVAFLTFIGSGNVGWMLRSKLAPGTRCALEHGGAAPVVMDQSADLDQAVPLLAKGGYYHAGQVCVSVQRVFAPPAMLPELAERIAAEAAKMTVGDPTLAETGIGPLIRPREADRIEEWIKEAVDGGAACPLNGARVSSSCQEPVILVDPPADCRVSQQEIFGPVICLYSAASMDEAIKAANAVPYSFQAAVFSRELDPALKAFKLLDAKTVMMNDHTAFRVDWMPFGGLNESGLGVGGISHTMNDMQVEKSLIIHSKNL
ncbi:aldehyde dehydrogenase family protein [Haloferula sp.]|uniref:aldehyde dehydrogenase family protein n=1 Tax=Haloferula sp. TaxID=2497595 RepID=UPI0032A10C17